MNSIKTIPFLLFLLSGYFSIAQPAAAIHKFDSIHQACIYKAGSQLHCAERYATEMDSMHNVLYTSLLARYEKAGKEKLKKEESDWITERDNYFEQVKTENAGLGDTEKQIATLEKDAGFVRKRVISLLNRLTY